MASTQRAGTGRVSPRSRPSPIQRALVPIPSGNSATTQRLPRASGQQAAAGGSPPSGVRSASKAPVAASRTRSRRSPSLISSQGAFGSRAVAGELKNPGGGHCRLQRGPEGPEALSESRCGCRASAKRSMSASSAAAMGASSPVAGRPSGIVRAVASHAAGSNRQDQAEGSIATSCVGDGQSVTDDRDHPVATRQRHLLMTKP